MATDEESAMNEGIERMLAARTFAVAGASTNPEKYGYKCYVDLKRFGKTVYPLNPRAATIDGDTCHPSVAALPEVPEVVVAVIPPALTERLVDELSAAGVKNLWIQPGAESAAAVAKAEAAGINTVHSGPCIMVGLRTHALRKQP
jgi:predicted CoA-binding protein